MAKNDHRFRVRIEPYLVPLIRKSAKTNGRSMPGEINHRLRIHYADPHLLEKLKLP